MTGRLYDRRVRLEIAGLEIRDLKIEFLIEREIEEPPSAVVSIYNLSSESEDRIRERGKALILDAGYPARFGTIYSGAVDRVTALFEPPTRVTRIQAGGKADAGSDPEKPSVANANGEVKVRSYPKGANVRQICIDLIAELGLEADATINLIPADKLIEREGGWVYSLGPASALTLLLRLEGLSLGWTEVDGVCVISPRRTAGEQAAGADPNEGLGAGAETVQLSASTGLVGSPVLEEQDKASCTSLLNPLLRIGTVVDIDSRTLTGKWRVAGLRHAGDNWRGRFISLCDLRQVQ